MYDSIINTSRENEKSSFWTNFSFNCKKMIINMNLNCNCAFDFTISVFNMHK